MMEELATVVGAAEEGRTLDWLCGLLRGVAQALVRPCVEEEDEVPADGRPPRLSIARAWIV